MSNFLGIPVRLRPRFGTVTVSRMFSTPEQRAVWRRRILALDPTDESAFESAALELFAFHFAHNEPYRRLAMARGWTPESVRSWRDIPAVPQSLFKETVLYSHPLKTARAIFHTSGTTTGQPGKHHLRDLDLYSAVCVEGAKRAGVLTGTQPLHFLAPPPYDAPHSSLSSMFGFWREGWGSDDSQFWVEKGQLQLERLRRQLEQTVEPVGLCGAAFGFVHWIDAFSQSDPVALPPGSWILETGGFKGRSREIDKMEFYEALGYLFGVKPEAIWNEYGMCELGSQAYASGVQGVHRTPPWARVLVVDPRTEREVPVGEAGLVRWIDLVNIDSVLGVQTLDQAVRHQDGFYLIGRLPQTEPRGCSLTAETFRRAGR